MEQPCSTLLFVILGFGFCIYAVLIEAQSKVESKPNAIPHPPPPPPPLPPPPPPTPLSPSPPPPSPSPPPPPLPSPPPPPLPSPPPPPLSSPPRPPLPPPPSSPPPSPLPPRPPRPPPPTPPTPNHHSSQKNSTDHSKNATTDPTTSNFNPNPMSNDTAKHHHDQKINLGKTIGLFFVGIAGILQICLVGFLTFKRRQLLKLRDRYETCSSS